MTGANHTDRSLLTDVKEAVFVSRADGTFVFGTEHGGHHCSTRLFAMNNPAGPTTGSDTGHHPSTIAQSRTGRLRCLVFLCVER